jgi:predicted choloylglycine hydrolase
MTSPTRRSFLKQATLAGASLWAAGRPLGAAEPKEDRRLTIVALEGPPRQRGLVHGKTLKGPIHELLKLWKADLAERYKMDADAFVKKFVKHTDYLPAIKKWTPDLLDEVRGIAEGAAVDFDTMLVFQLIDEYWVNGPGVAGEHCSSIGAARRGDRPTLIAQNMDLEGFREGSQVVLRIAYPNSKREALVLTNAGLIALNGLNNRGVGICCNTLTQLANCRDGLPVACVVRGVLERETEQAALDFLRQVKHASGQNYIIGGPSQVHCYECSAGKVSRFMPTPESDLVWHTNHPLVNDDYTPAYRKALEQKGEKKPDNSTVRLQCVEKRLGKDSAVVGMDLIKATLTAKDSAEFPVCRPYKNKKDNFTFASTIMVLGDQPALHIAPGPPDVHPYRVLS